jgi:hypothetical protein
MIDPAYMAVLAQTAEEIQQDVHQFMVVGMILIAVVLATFIVALWLRRWSKRDDDLPPAGFTPDDLRKLVREGKMTEAEYKVASAKVFGKLKNKHLAPTDPDPAAVEAEVELPKPPRPPRSPRPPLSHE